MGVIRYNFNNIRGHQNGGGGDSGDEWIYISSDGYVFDLDFDYDNDFVVDNYSEESFAGQNDSRSNHQNNGRSHRQSSSNNKSNRKLLPTKPEPTFSALGTKGKSHKKFRRYANANLLNDLGNLINETDLDDEISINDFIQSSPSSFTLLMDSCTNPLFNLNDFINCTEDKQSILLDRVIEFELEKHHWKDSTIINNDVDDDIENVCVEDSNLCFSRISPTIRKQLLKKHVPLGILASIEQKVIQHFRHHPKSIYKTALQCSYQRFLLHACCQYLNLNCRSSNNNGKRLSSVHNGRFEFIEPSKLLSEHLDK